LGDGIGGLTSLTYLNLEDCDSLALLGDGIGGCTALEQLFLQRCSSLTSLGDDLRQLLERQGCEIIIESDGY